MNSSNMFGKLNLYIVERWEKGAHVYVGICLTTDNAQIRDIRFSFKIKSLPSLLSSLVFASTKPTFFYIINIP